MPMHLQPVTALLAEAGLNAPVLKALVPDVNNYEVLLLQPEGAIVGDTAGVRNRDRALAAQQFGQFLADALECKADLAITPEYSMPWATLIQAIENNAVPAVGKLWALGCESITYAGLQQVKQDLMPYAEVLFETLVPDTRRFLDPLAYVFRTTRSNGDGTERVVILVQFKTCAMGDKAHYEVNALLCGTKVYQFGGPASDGLRLFSVICSDAFAIEDSHAVDMFDRALVIHIQLNPMPRQSQFRRYRDRLMEYKGDATEILCLNWAENVVEWTGMESNAWHNIGGSAWYLRPGEFDDADETLQENHQRGLYYTWFNSIRAHALFFNYKPATFLLTATKVAHIGVKASLANRRGPQLTRTRVWDPVVGSWVDQPAADDGFAAFVPTTGASVGAQNAIIQMAKQNAFVAERILALSAGEFAKREDWYKVNQLDSCQLPECEEIQRITFCHDSAAHNFRVGRVKRGGALWDHLQVEANLPAALKDLKDGFQFTWTKTFPHQNLVSARDRRATVINVGEGKTLAQAEAIALQASEFLRRTIADPDARHSARQRLAVWYRDATGALVLYDPNPLQTIDSTGDESALDIGRGS